MSSSKSNSTKEPKGKNVLGKMLAERTSFDEEIAKSLQFIEDFDITDKDITDKEAREYMKHTDRIRRVQRQQRRLMRNIQNTKSNYRRHRRQSLPTFTPPPSAVAAPAPVAVPVAAPAPSSVTASTTSPYIEKGKYKDEGDEYTTEERKIWEQKLKDSVLYKIDIPEDWVPSPIIEGSGVDNSSSYSLIRLDKDGECYKSLLKEYINTFRGRINSHNIEIYKVQNYEKLYEFIRNREILINKIGEENLNETTLYHGTKQGIEICSTGLDMRYGKGGLYGNGIYFADRSDISMGFSNGLITINRVLLGKKYFSSSHQRYIHPPGGHNSVFAKRGRGHEYILYNNNYSYIEYIVCDNNLKDRGSVSSLQGISAGFSTRGGNNPGASTYYSYRLPGKRTSFPPRRSQRYIHHPQLSTQIPVSHPAAQSLIKSAANAKRKTTLSEKRLYYKKAKYNKAGEWKFPTVTGKVDWKIGSTDYEININTDGEDITAIIKYCEKFNVNKHSLTPTEQRVSRTGNNNALLQKNIDYKKTAFSAFKNGMKIIEKAKHRASSNYKMRKQQLIYEIERRKSECGGLKNKTWLYYSSSYKRYQLVNILLMDDAIMASADKIINNCKNAITRLQRRCRNRIIKKKMDMIAVSNAASSTDEDNTINAIHSELAEQLRAKYPHLSIFTTPGVIISHSELARISAALMNEDNDNDDDDD